MPLNLVGAAIVFGIIFGVVSFGILALKTLRIIEKKGVFTMSVSKWLFLAGALFIFLGLFTWAFITLPLQAIVLVGDFLYPALPAGLLARLFLYWRWERKNKRMIYTTWGFSGKIYAYSYITNTT
jgi:hypothetical protein